MHPFWSMKNLTNQQKFLIGLFLHALPLDFFTIFGIFQPIFEGQAGKPCPWMDKL